jgi:hypothetical protein
LDAKSRGEGAEELPDSLKVEICTAETFITRGTSLEWTALRAIPAFQFCNRTMISNFPI